MATQVLKRSRAKFVSKQTVEQVGIFLQELPEKTPDTLSLRQTIERLRESIEAALAKGYSYEELVPMLAQQGIDIQPSTLKRYVLTRSDRTGKRAGKTTRGRRRKAVSDEVDDTDAVSKLTATSGAAVDDEDDTDDISDAPARKRGRADKETASEPLPIEEAEPVRSTRTRRRSTASSAKSSPRSTSSRRRRS
ncbi:hypothetical protein [Thermocoleostomius sinensis]|uniref:Mobilization protein MobC n=1 Tax=Thermocoleostomius sinensis A174 TaxID=2016057 RepID=A0A9E8ZHQ6_9CYAN|nr:hypothetical protein [Thermocoleostomius sinensis]WAL61425.1 hypothetical protein OXH18_05390 [Thermocoleostomius sinensis A174]